MIDLPSSIRIARETQKLTQEDLADMVGVTERQISRWENGDSTPRKHALSALEDALNMRLRTGPSEKELLRVLRNIREQIDQVLLRTEDR